MTRILRCCLIATALTTLVLATLPAAEPTARLTDEGGVRCGDRELVASHGRFRLHIAGREVAELLPYWTDSVGRWGAPERNQLTTPPRIDPVAGTAVWSGKAGPAAGAPSWRVALNLAGGSRVGLRLAVEGADLTQRRAMLRLLCSDAAGRAFADGGTSLSVGADGDPPHRGLRDPVLTCFAAPGDARRWSVATLGAPLPGLRDLVGEAEPRYEVRWDLAARGSAELVLELDLAPAGAGPEPVTDAADPLGWQLANRARLPWTAGCANRVLNGGFEAGLGGWQFMNNANLGIAASRDAVVLDEMERYEGERSLRFTIPADGGERASLPMVAPYAMQLVSGRPVTISLAARADRAGLNLTTLVVSKDLGKWIAEQRLPLGTTWQRHRFTFTPGPGQTLAALYLGVFWGDRATFRAVRDTPAQIWLDAVQVEDGAIATPYVQAPARISRGDTPALQTLAGTRVLRVTLANDDRRPHRWSARATVRDLLRRELLVRELPVTRLLAGEERVWDLEPGPVLDYLGIYGLEVELREDGRICDRVFLRTAVIDPFSRAELASRPNRRIFGLGANLPPAGDQERTLRRLRELGVGFLEPGHMLPVQPALAQLLADEGIATLVGLVGDAPGSDPWSHDFLRASKPAEPAALARLLAALPARLAANPLHRTWKYLNEPPIWDTDPTNLVATWLRPAAALLRATTPAPVLVSPDPANNFDGGRGWLERLLAAGGGDCCDVLAIHPYRNRPEQPDLEKDTEAFIALADRHGFRGELWYTEGGAHPIYRLPAIGISPSRTLSGDMVRMPAFTDDLFGDPTGMALHVRTLLTVLRYADRVPVYVNWFWNLHGFYEALTDQPREVGMAYHALARGFGRARFQRAIAWHEALRCYVFDDGAGAGVAAAWDHDERLESGARPPYRLILPAGVVASDLFGRPLPPGPLALGPLPVVLRGGTPAALADALAAAELDLGSNGSLELAAAVRPGGALVAVARNRGSAAAEVAISGRCGDTPVQQRITVPARGSADLALPATGGGLHRPQVLALDAQAGPATATLRSTLALFSIPRRRQALSADGDLADWGDSAAWKLDGPAITYRPGGWEGPADHATTLRLCWDDEGLWLAAVVTDDRQHQPHPLAKAWSGDSLQLFVDAFKDATPLLANTDDDWTWLLALASDHAQALRQAVPARQYAFLGAGEIDSEATLAVKRDEALRTTTYELRLPGSRLAPLALKPGAVFGLGLLVNDADSGEQRDSALSTAGSQELWQQPHRLAWAVLARD